MQNTWSRELGEKHNIPRRVGSDPFEEEEKKQMGRKGEAGKKGKAAGRLGEGGSLSSLFYAGKAGCCRDVSCWSLSLPVGREREGDFRLESQQNQHTLLDRQGKETYHFLQLIP
jgi:hypothetical protein